MERREAIYLDSIDGFEFERICQRMFERIYGCPVEDTPPTGDEGKDLLIHSPDGLIVVECKHQPQSSIGRPIVQKLHSAIIDSGARNGIIVTTGSIAKSAREYAERLRKTGIIIELYDRAILADMASRAGMIIVVDGMKVPVWSYDVSNKERFEKILANHLDGLYESYPARPSTMLQVQSRDIDLIPSYEITYRIDAVFETSVGVIHHERLPIGSFFIDGVRGSILKDVLSSFYSSIPTLLFPVDSVKEWHPNSTPFSIEISRVKEISSNEIIRRHSRLVRYYGRNNHSYSKECIPNTQQFTITSIRQLYFPLNRSRIVLKNTPIKFGYLEHPTGKIMVLDDHLNECGICGGAIKQNPFLCNVCGNPTHPKKIIDSHGFRCKGCGKIICRRCASYIPSFIFFKRVLCDSCIRGQPSTKIRKFSALG